LADQTVTLTVTKADAEVVLGVLTAERYNTTVQAVCDKLAAQIEQKLEGA
jgi:hypothetical protein